MLEIASIILCGVAIFSVVYLAFAFFDYLLSANRPVREVRDEDHPLPDDAMNIIMELQAYHFSYLGAMEFKTYVRLKPYTEWVFVHQDRNIILQLTDAMSAAKGIVLQFGSSFPDGARVETYFPGRGRIQSSTYRFSKVKSSVGEAFALHQREVADFFLDHGAPVKFYTMNDVIEHEQISNQRHGKIRLRPSLYQLTFAVIWMVAFAILSTLVAFDLASDLVDGIFGLIVFIGALPVIFSGRD